MPTADDFKRELDAQIERAVRQGRPHLEVNAGELHRAVGNYPGDHRMPLCCGVMRQEALRGRAGTVSETDSGNGAALTIRYKLPRNV